MRSIKLERVCLMIRTNCKCCPECKSSLKKYDKVKRIVRLGGSKRAKIKLQRLRCIKCGKTHRELPEYLLKHKHYHSEIIFGVINGSITSSIIEFEDYPTEIFLTPRISITTCTDNSSGYLIIRENNTLYYGEKAYIK